LKQLDVNFNKYLKTSNNENYKSNNSGQWRFRITDCIQTAFHGYAVMVYDISDDILEKSKTFKIGDSYKADLNASQKQIDETMDRLSFSSDLEKLANADLVIESVPEDPSIKKIFKKASSCSRKPFSLNSSTMLLASLPNQQVDQLNCSAILPTRYGNITQLKLWDILGRMRTYLTPLLRLKSIGMVALPLKQPGYRQLTTCSFIKCRTRPIGKGVADVHTIDKTWMVAT
jgi:3-hydroxybutyryl-CoA dehydrogenase